LASLLTVIFLILFIYFNRRHQIFDFSVFKQPKYTITTTILFIGNGVTFTSLVILPLWLRSDLHYPILEAGLVVAIAGGLSSVCSPLIGKFISARFYQRMVLCSLCLTSFSFFIVSTFTVDTPMETIIISRVIAGIGLATFTMPLMTISLKEFNKKEYVNGNSISMMLRILASNILVAVSFNYFNVRSYLLREEYIANIDGVSAQKFLDVEPYVMSLDSIFHTMAISEMFKFTSLFFLMSFFSLLLLLTMFNNKKN